MNAIRSIFISQRIDSPQIHCLQVVLEGVGGKLAVRAEATEANVRLFNNKPFSDRSSLLTSSSAGPSVVCGRLFKDAKEPRKPEGNEYISPEIKAVSSVNDCSVF